MIINALRAIAGNWLNEIKPLVDAATLVHLPVTPHEVLPRDQPLETMSEVSIHFRLPYPITAVEDNASCVLLIDPKPHLRGLDEQRLFVECVPLDADEDRYNDAPLARAFCESTRAGSIPGVYAVSAGWISSPAQKAGAWLAQAELLWVVTGTIGEQHTTAADFQTLPTAVNDAMTQAAVRNVTTAIEELIALDRGKLVISATAPPCPTPAPAT